MSTKKTTSKPKKTVAKPRQKPTPKRTASAKAVTGPRDPNAPAIGTTLKRQFKGQDIAVKVTADGFQYEGQTFKSISACARHICGYMVSGPVFFKLVEPKAATKPEALR
jgi:hypothetical protein